jgi:hypothetical protein
MWDFLKFRKLITPMFIQVLMWLGVLISLIMGIVWLVRGITDDYSGGKVVIQGLFTLLFGPLFARIWGEKTTILFRMYDKVCSEALGEKPPTP